MTNIEKKQLSIAGLIGFSIILGWKLAEGSFFLLIPILIVGFLGILQRGHKIQPEAIVLSFLFAGYILGNRGFAQLNIMGVFVGELGMLSLLGLGFLHIGTQRNLPYKTDTLGVLILFFILTGFVRLLFDFSTYGIAAVRDYATCYYAVFYFLVHPIEEKSPSQRLIIKTLILSLSLLIPTYFLFDQFTDFFLSTLVLNETPLIYFKGDLAAAFLGSGFFIFYYKVHQKPLLIWTLLASGSFLMLLYTTSRSALMGFLIACLIYFFSGMKTLWRFLLITLSLVAVPFLYFTLADDTPFIQTKAFAVFEHVISIVDLSGNYEYRNREAMNSGDNNRYRLEWWQSVIDETLHYDPIFGLGFGYDLAKGFLNDYYGNTDMDFTVRSPHSIVITLFGRMGLIGMGGFILIFIKIFQLTLSAIHQSRQNGEITDNLPYWAMVWVILVAACFGVVLEGPMGAIVFWSLLGMANRTK